MTTGRQVTSSQSDTAPTNDSVQRPAEPCCADCAASPPPDPGCDYGFYVTCIRSARQRALLLGPFATHPEALAAVPQGRRLAEAADPRCAFDGFGTARLVMPPGDSLPNGYLNPAPIAGGAPATHGRDAAELATWRAYQAHRDGPGFGVGSVYAPCRPCRYLAESGQRCSEGQRLFDVWQEAYDATCAPPPPSEASERAAGVVPIAGGAPGVDEWAPEEGAPGQPLGEAPRERSERAAATRRYGAALAAKRQRAWRERQRGVERSVGDVEAAP